MADVIKAGMSSIQAYVMEQGKSCRDEETQGKAQVGETLYEANTDDLQMADYFVVVDEAPVMEWSDRG